MLNNAGTDMGTTTGGQFAEGTPVYDADGNKVGSVSEHGTQHGCLVVHHGFFRQDVYVPLDAVSRNTTNGVNLSLNQDQFNALPHNQPPDDQPTQWTTMRSADQTTGVGVDQMVTPVGGSSVPTMGPVTGVGANPIVLPTPDQAASDAARTSTANAALNNQGNTMASQSLPPLGQQLGQQPGTPGTETTVSETELRETTLPPNLPTDTLVAGEVSNEGVTMQAPNPADNVGSGTAMNETGGWANLGDRDLVTGTPASAEVRGATPSFPDGNNVAGTRQGPELLQPRDTIGGTPVGNDTGVMGTGAGPVGTSMGPGVLGNDRGDVTVNATGPANQTNTPDMQDTSTDAMPNAVPLASGTRMDQGSMAGSGNTTSDVTVDGSPLPMGRDAVLGSGGLIGSRDTGAYATSGIIGPETGDTGQTDSGLVGIGNQGAADTQQAQSGFEGTDSQGTGDTAQADTGLLGWADQGAANTRQAQSGLEGSGTRDAITNSTAGTEFTGTADPGIVDSRMAGAQPQPGGPLSAGPRPMGGLAQAMTPGDMGDVSTRPIVDEVPPSGANPDLVEASTNSAASNDVGTVGAAPSGIVGGYADTGTAQANAMDTANSGNAGLVGNSASTGLVGGYTGATGGSTGVIGSAANTGPEGRLASQADTGIVGSGVSATGDTLPANLAQGGAQPGQNTLADQLRADQPVGDVLSPEENTNQPPA